MDFNTEARNILNLKIANRINSNGGYGVNNEVIFNSHPFGAPAVQTDKKGAASVSFYSNGSVDFRIQLKDFPEIAILQGSFDKMDKREINIPSQNIWLEIDGQITSLINPSLGFSLNPVQIRIIKVNNPFPAMWYCAKFCLKDGTKFETAVKLWLDENKFGPILKREVYIDNNSKKEIKGNVWSYFNLPSKMEHTWDRDIWYNRGMPINDGNIIVASTVPHRDMVQIKRVVSGCYGGIKYKDATCDYISFIGHSGASALLPMAIQQKKILDRGAGNKMNRFSTPSIAASQYLLSIAPKSFAVLQQGVLYVNDEKVISNFRKEMETESVHYLDMEKSFQNASIKAIKKTGFDLFAIQSKQISQLYFDEKSEFQLKLPNNPELEAFFSSIWNNINSIYNRSYGRKIAEGYEIGMRDRAQDMWPMIKDKPSVVREDLIHSFSMMYTLPGFTGKGSKPLKLSEKIHGMFPRQYPSKWLDRTQKVSNDNRPFADSALWPIESLLKYINETGDYSIFIEKTQTSTLIDFDDPVNSKMTGSTIEYTIIEIVNNIFKSYARHIEDSPYGMAQVLYGDWADPIEMMGTSIPGDITTKAKGRGTSVRLSEHLFLVIIKYIDFLRTNRTTQLLDEAINIESSIEELSSLANKLRINIIRFAWEDSVIENSTGFISFIHEFNFDGSLPDYKKGETGYTIGSMLKRDFDGVNRRELLSNAYGLEMISIERDYLDSISEKEIKIRRIIEMTDNLLSDKVLGVRLLSKPVANNNNTIKYCGRLGMIGSGCSENGEYHHAANMMQYFRLGLPNQINLAWKYYKPLLSVYRDEYLNGPFDSFANAYASDSEDPHFGAGMYFGFSGSLDWTIEIIERIAGIELNLYNADLPDIKVTPKIPDDFKNNIEFRRTIHKFKDGKFIKIPIQIKVQSAKTEEQQGIWVNGEKCERAEIENLKDMKSVNILFVNPIP